MAKKKKVHPWLDEDESATRRIKKPHEKALILAQALPSRPRQLICKVVGIFAETKDKGERERAAAAIMLFVHGGVAMPAAVVEAGLKV